MENVKRSTRYVTLEEVMNHPEVHVFMDRADENLAKLGYTEHGRRHCKLVSKSARRLMEQLRYEARFCELAAVAGYLHDLGNVVCRTGHSQASAFLAYQILKDLGAPPDDIAIVLGAVASHNDKTSGPVSDVAAAVCIADKADVHSSRVRNLKEIDFDIHDRVNHAVKRSVLLVDADKREITLDLKVDTRISNPMEYFEIFLARMLSCRKAAKVLDCTYHLVLNDARFT